jgi:hypothetical protein
MAGEIVSHRWNPMTNEKGSRVSTRYIMDMIETKAQLDISRYNKTIATKTKGSEIDD